MVTFELVPNCIDTMLFSTPARGKNRKVLKSCGYSINEDETEVTMEFYDGIAIATDGSGLQMTYPKIATLTEKQKESISDYCGRNDCTQYEVALKYGKLCDNMGMKFKVGDRVVNKFGDVWHIDSYDNKNYQVSDGKGNHNYFPIEKQDEMHLIGNNKKRVFSEEQFCWFAETIIRLSADLFNKIAEDPETWDENEVVEFIRKNALRFEKELQWQGKDDGRFYLEELDKFKEKLLAEKGIGGK